VTADAQSCKLPVLDPYSKEIAHIVPTQAPMKCNEKELYTTLENNVLRLRDDRLNGKSVGSLHKSVTSVKIPEWYGYCDVECIQ
jgi:hypothetical protein